MNWGVSNLTVAYGSRTALDDVSLSVVPGQTLCVIGGDGAGKSTLLKVLAGERLVAEGEIVIPAPQRIGFVPASGGFYRDLSIDENMAFAASAYGVTGWRDRARSLLAHAGLDGFGDRVAGTLSGGQQRKLAGSIALLANPDLLILDEMTTGVDPVSRMELWRIISGAVADGAAVVAATTYLDEAERATECVLLDEGRLLARGTAADIEASAPGHLYDLAHPEDRDAAWRHGRRWRQWSPLPIGSSTPVEPNLEDAAIMLQLSNAGDAEPSRRSTERPAAGSANGESANGAHTGGGKVLVDAKGLTCRFGSLTAVDQLDLRVRAGEIVGLIGANGAGKTTFVKMLLGLLPPTDGEISVFGRPFERATRRRVGYVPQHLGLYSDLTVDENLAFRATMVGAAPADAAGDLAAVRRRLISATPLGLQRQAAFLAATQHAPQLLILDEPTSGVSALARSRLWDLIHAQAERGVGVLVSTHYMDEAVQADRVVMMARGRAIASGTVEQVIGDHSAVVVSGDRWADAFRVLDRDGRWVRMDGKAVRVLGAESADIRAELREAAVDGVVSTAPATLDEVMVLLGGQSMSHS